MSVGGNAGLRARSRGRCELFRLGRGVDQRGQPVGAAETAELLAPGGREADGGSYRRLLALGLGAGFGAIYF
jgi:hypothetical protein